MKELIAGVGTLARGFGVWRTQPKLMTLGLVPALIAFAVLAAVVVPALFSLGWVTELITPFADGWAVFWRGLLRVALGIALGAGLLVLSGLVFTALTLTIGDPFYERIWRAVEEDLGGDVPESTGGFWTTLVESFSLVLWGLLIAVGAFVIGFVPGVGAPVAAVGGFVCAGLVLSRELTGRSFNARDYSGTVRQQLFRTGRARTLGFGIATQACFTIPLGAIVTMPAAVAGSTILAHELRARYTAAHGHEPGSPAPDAPLPPAPTES